MSARNRIYRPGEIVPTSGQYGVVDAVGTYLGRQVTCVRGSISLPPGTPVSMASSSRT